MGGVSKGHIVCPKCDQPYGEVFKYDAKLAKDPDSGGHHAEFRCLCGLRLFFKGRVKLDSLYRSWLRQRGEHVSA